MRIEIVAIGYEILSGFTLDTNSTFLSQQLARLGLRVARHTVLSDDPKQLQEGLEDALNRSDLVIATGGLGPTRDDITRSIAAKLFDSDFEQSEQVASDLIGRYSVNLPSLKDQASVPTKATPLINSVGTAPGLLFDEGGKQLILLPGVPAEMKAIFGEHVLSYLKAEFSHLKRYHYRSLHVLNLSEPEVDPHVRAVQDQYSEFDYGIYPGMGVVAVRIGCEADTEEEALQRIETPYKALSKALESHLFHVPEGSIEESLQALFCKNKWTLSLAESCTGGAIAARLSKVPGASNYFLGSVVSYANSLKTNLLNVSQESLQVHGAVSREVVTEMAQGALDATGSDYSIAISGIAGPTGGSAQKPIGTLWCAIGKKGEAPHTWQTHAYGNRETIIEWGVNVLLGELLRRA